MYRQFYEHISEPFRSRHMGHALLQTDKALVAAIAATYVIVGIWLAAQLDMRIVRYAAVCAAEFALATWLRAALNRPRPYEAHQIDPLIAKDTKGKSFPSRHVSSAAVISCAFLWLNPWLGLVGLLATIALAAIRVIGGVHFPRDVIAGAAIGALCGLIGFWII